jgi:hypothetical protein
VTWTDTRGHEVATRRRVPGAARYVRRTSDALSGISLDQQPSDGALRDACECVSNDSPSSTRRRVTITQRHGHECSRKPGKADKPRFANEQTRCDSRITEFIVCAFRPQPEGHLLVVCPDPEDAPTESQLQSIGDLCKSLSVRR